jgi:hypothetical protein
MRPARIVVLALVAFALAAVAFRLRADLPALPPRPEPSDGLDELTREELYERAQAAEIRGRSQMTKAQLIEALRNRT